MYFLSGLTSDLYDERVVTLARILSETIFGDIDEYVPMVSEEPLVERQGLGKRQALREFKDRKLLDSNGGKRPTLSSE